MLQWDGELLQGVKAMQNPDGSCQGWGSGHLAKVPFWMGQLVQQFHWALAHFVGIQTPAKDGSWSSP